MGSIRAKHGTQLVLIIFDIFTLIIDYQVNHQI